LIKENEQEQLINDCKAGNRQAQEKLYRSFYRAMMNLCLRFTKTEVDAMEALNSGFYKVFKNIHLYSSHKASLYTWIRTIIINSCLNVTRANEKVQQHISIDEALHTSQQADVLSKMNSAHILNMIRKLPAATQAVFNLFMIEGYSHKEIADMLNISEGTSKWHVNDARKKLQSMINENNIT
jgi:RNA polymerase sigma factor (sigma-70 family)